MYTGVTCIIVTWGEKLVFSNRLPQVYVSTSYRLFNTYLQRLAPKQDALNYLKHWLSIKYQTIYTKRGSSLDVSILLYMK